MLTNALQHEFFEAKIIDAFIAHGHIGHPQGARTEIIDGSVMLTVHRAHFIVMMALVFLTENGIEFLIMAVR
jgi:hypothetical protein